MVNILLLADTHLGFDLPFRPRVERRRRGHDFFVNFERALEPALRGDVDLVVHAGDLFYRSKIPTALVEMAMAPLIRVAKQNVPVFIVPGNHESGNMPLQLWTQHPNLSIFDRPRTFIYQAGGLKIALAGFPFTRNIRDEFSLLIQQTGYREVSADIYLLCLHQAVEGAQVGVQNYTFRSGLDVVRGSDIPAEIAAVLGGHIHRAQVLRHDLSRRPLPAPVIYPGSIERTSFAERDEQKCYAIVTLDGNRGRNGRLVNSRFVPLPTRPMVRLVLEPELLSRDQFIVDLKECIRRLDPESIVRLELVGNGAEIERQWLSAAKLRSLAPATMNITMGYRWSQFKRKQD